MLRVEYSNTQSEHVYFLYRNRAEPAYTEAERSFCDWVAPHLWATWTANWIAQMEHIRANNAASRVAHAICDQRAILHSAEPRFVELLRQEWPDWRDPRCPRRFNTSRCRCRSTTGRRLRCDHSMRAD